MRLAEPIETTGMFWLPEQPDTQLSGVLKISESSEITVDLAGAFGNPLVTPRRFDVSDDAEQRRRLSVRSETHSWHPTKRRAHNFRSVSLARIRASLFRAGYLRQLSFAELAFVGAPFTAKKRRRCSQNLAFP